MLSNINDEKWLKYVLTTKKGFIRNNVYANAYRYSNV